MTSHTPAVVTELSQDEEAEYAPPRYTRRSRTRPGKGIRSQRRERLRANVQIPRR